MDKVEFKYHIKIGMNDNGQFGVQTNIASRVLGYGMLEEAKKAIDVHIKKLQERGK